MEEEVKRNNKSFLDLFFSDKFLFFFWTSIFLSQFFLAIFHWREGKIASFLVEIIPYFNLFFFFFAYFLIFFKEKNKRIIFEKTLPVFLFFTFAGFSFLWSVNKERTLATVTFYLMPLFTSLLIPIFLHSPQEFLLKIISLVSSLGLFSAVFALFLLCFGEIEFRESFFLQKISFGPVQIFQIIQPFYPSFAPHSLFSNKNFFGFFLSISTFFTFFLYFFKKKFLYLPSLFLQFFVLLLTYSRASLLSFLGFFIGFFLFLFLKKKSSFSFFVLFPLLLLFFVSFFLSPKFWLTQITDGFNKRTDLWKTALSCWRESPIFGKGFNSTYSINLQIHGLYLSAHNVFFNLLCELGIIGVFLFSLLWFYPLKVGFDNWRKTKSPSKILFLSMLLGYQVGVFIEELFETRIFYHFTLPIWGSFTLLLLHPFFEEEEI